MQQKNICTVIWSSSLNTDDDSWLSLAPAFHGQESQIAQLAVGGIASLHPLNQRDTRQLWVSVSLCMCSRSRLVTVGHHINMTTPWMIKILVYSFNKNSIGKNLHTHDGRPTLSSLHFPLLTQCYSASHAQSLSNIDPRCTINYGPTYNN